MVRVVDGAVCAGEAIRFLSTGKRYEVAEVANAEDRIAILIDRNGYTIHAREAIFALRPAPIQINSIGFPGTLGAEWYDYIFTDRFSLPESLQRFYTERPLYMPHMAFPSDTTRLAPGPPPTRAACGAPAAQRAMASSSMSPTCRRCR